MKNKFLICSLVLIFHVSSFAADNLNKLIHHWNGINQSLKKDETLDAKLEKSWWQDVRLLKKFALKGDKRACKALLSIWEDADGWVAEGLDEILADLDKTCPR